MNNKMKLVSIIRDKDCPAASTSSWVSLYSSTCYKLEKTFSLAVANTRRPPAVFPMSESSLSLSLSSSRRKGSQSCGGGEQNKKPMASNGVSYGLGDRDFRTKEQKRKELKRQSEMATRIQTRSEDASCLPPCDSNANGVPTKQAQKQLEQLRQQRQHEQVCTVVIQKIVHGRVQWNRYQTTLAVRKTAAVLLQSLVRSRQARIAYRKKMTAAHDIQVFVTLRRAGCWKARKEVACRRKERAAATAIQTMFRTQAAIAKAQTRRDAVLLLQSAWRRYQAQSELSSMMLEAEFQKATRHKLQIDIYGDKDTEHLARFNCPIPGGCATSCSKGVCSSRGTRSSRGATGLYGKEDSELLARFNCEISGGYATSRSRCSRGDRSSSVLHFRIHSHVWANERKKSLSPITLDVARAA
ncbi:hypothetical protein PsorP6_018153 [Peronosclerospora sorghi]|uniref:Uncharacterized protein n=1 Tax=Peronosclerospora sorghi TaxID=230839 RepID=A0ACC0WDB1_9STRA|nr:hypothetical protein PsorP6_018153 [Peronosclerospora sorghi]